MRWLRWLAPAVAVGAVFLLPALRLTLPLVAPAQWTVAELAEEAVRATPGRAQPGGGPSPSLRALLRQAQALRRQWSPSPPAGGAGADELTLGLALAALIPVMAVLAGLCALLSLLWQGWRHPRLGLFTAGVGLAATGYALGAAWWLTRALQAEVAQFFARAQHSFGGLLRGLDWKALQAGLGGPLGVVPQAGLYVLALAFVAMLVAPAED
ncbi:MAG TPA: hypothetical protein VMV31_08055 [Terriglobales bacterium]|nr:hypothetical protein [Terriglobales bacterium]